MCMCVLHIDTRNTSYTRNQPTSAIAARPVENFLIYPRYPPRLRFGPKHTSTIFDICMIPRRVGKKPPSFLCSFEGDDNNMLTLTMAFETWATQRLQTQLFNMGGNWPPVRQHPRSCWAGLLAFNTYIHRCSCSLRKYLWHIPDIVVECQKIRKCTRSLFVVSCCVAKVI